MDYKLTLKGSTVLHAVNVFNAISRRRAAQPRTDKRLGGVPFAGYDFPMSPVLCEQRRVARFSGPSDWLPFLVRFWASCQSSAASYADKNERS
jgi:hypothetical protein